MNDSVLFRLRSEGSEARIADDERGAPDAALVVEKILAATATKDAARVVALWDEAGARHDLEALDVAVPQLTSGAWMPFSGRPSPRRLRESARMALAGTTRAGTVELAAAVLGATGEEADAETLETLGRHPAFTLHAATALSNLRHWKGRASLLRLLSATQGAARVTVIDRLLPHVGEPAVRLALVRDALVGLAPEHAREVAADIAALCMVKECIDDPSAPQDVKDGARLVLAACPTERQE